MTDMKITRRQFILKTSVICTSMAFISKTFSMSDVNDFILRATNQKTKIGFNGERIDPVISCYHLGQGHRTYNPALRRFHSLDKESPFGEGGVNPYTYCLNDPVNYIDDTGNLSWQAWLAIGLGVLSVILGVLTFGVALAGLSLAIAGGASAMAITASALNVTSAALGIVASVLGIASAAISESDPHTSETLSWVGLGFGIASLLTGLGGFGLSRMNSASMSVKMADKPVPMQNLRGGYKVGGIDVTPVRVKAHGVCFNTVANYQGERFMNGKQLGSLIQGLNKNSTIQLNVCFGGWGGRFSTAQLVANQTGKVVHATSGFSVVSRGSSALTQTFKPLTGISGAISTRGGVMLSHFTRSAIIGEGVIYTGLPMLKSLSFRVLKRIF
jgi:RHS repeat-associated protein